LTQGGTVLLPRREIRALEFARQCVVVLVSAGFGEFFCSQLIFLKVPDMKQQQRGFTLIELVMVIVILGVLAAVAIPKFVDLKTEAQAAALAGVVGGVNSASAVNYAARSANSGKGTATIGLTCQTAAAAIMQGGVPTGYSLAATTLIAGDNACVVTQAGPPAATASAVIIGIN
jgi:MSHA pilin protein MshA